MSALMEEAQALEDQGDRLDNQGLCSQAREYWAKAAELRKEASE
jgi:hypothetical protein|tara:strand:- start:6909 stop:7040 length:132 start_codon:yes stop_codon:yes gene_type:complete